MIDNFMISQVLIGIAFLFAIASFQFKKREHILVCFFILMLLIGAHYYFLGQITALWIYLFGALRIFIAIFTTNKRWMFILAVGIVGVFILTYTKALDFIILAASLIFNFGAFQENDKRLRRFELVGAQFVVLYNLLIFSPAMVSFELFMIASNIIGYYRYYIKKS